MPNITMPEKIQYSVDRMMNFCDPASFGVGEDDSGTQATMDLQEDYSWLVRLFNGGASRRALTNMTVAEDCATGEKRFRIGTQGNLVPATMEGTPCCVKLPSMEGRQRFATVDTWCVEDCLTEKDIYWLTQQKGSQLSLKANVAKLKGNDEYQRRLDLLRRTAMFQMARQYLFGEAGVFGDNLLPFHGVQELLSQASTVNIDGTNLVTAIEQIDCFTRSFRGDWIAIGNQFAIDAFNRTLAEIQTMTGVSMLGNIEAYDVSMLDIDEDMTSDLILLNLDHVGAIADNSSLNPYAHEIEEDINYQDDMSLGACKTVCSRVRGIGSVFTDDYNSVIRVSNLAVPTACLPFIGRIANRVGVETILPR